MELAMVTVGFGWVLAGSGRQRDQSWLLGKIVASRGRRAYSQSMSLRMTSTLPEASSESLVAAPSDHCCIL